MQLAARYRIRSAGLIAIAIVLTGQAAYSADDTQPSAHKPVAASALQRVPPIDLSRLAKITTVDERYQSFNVEMVEVTGGRFWAPYDAGDEEPTAPAANTPGVAGDGSLLGTDTRSIFRYRPPLDMTDPRLRKLAGALAPAYMRVSGSWANTTYFHDSNEPAPEQPPAGYAGILTRAQWQEVLDFSKSLGLDIMLSFAISDGTRDPDGVWLPTQARALFNATETLGGEIAAVEFMNETTMGKMQGLPANYSAEDYARDFKRFRSLVKEVSPDTVIAGPSAVAEEAAADIPGLGGKIRTEDIYEFMDPAVDALSYHYYGGLSLRCAAGMGLPIPQASQALAPQWLEGTGKSADFYGALRDRVEPGKPLWLTETAETACGGNPWASTFIDSFRYVDQLGRLARRSVQTVMHNTLVASDYGLIDEDTLEPRPNYWAALLWRQLMGTVVLDAGGQSGSHTTVYAHCLRDVPGGVALVALNIDSENAAVLVAPGVTKRYTLSTSGPLETQSVLLNGEALAMTDKNELPALRGQDVTGEIIELAPVSITFLTAPEAGNSACGT